MFGLLGGALLGGLLGGSDDGGSQTQQRQLDPRLVPYVFGANGTGGLVGTANELFNRQMSQGGLNDIQRQGLGMQQQYLMSPQYQRGGQAMYDRGMSLLGGPVAGNPFTSGGFRGLGGGLPMGGGQPMPQMQRPFGGFGPSLDAGQPSSPQGGFQYQPVPMTPAPDYSNVQPQQQITQSQIDAMLEAYLRRIGFQMPNYNSWEDRGDGDGGASGSGSGDAGDDGDDGGVSV